MPLDPAACRPPTPVLAEGPQVRDARQHAQAHHAHDHVAGHGAEAPGGAFRQEGQGEQRGRQPDTRRQRQRPQHHNDYSTHGVLGMLGDRGRGRQACLPAAATAAGSKVGGLTTMDGVAWGMGILHCCGQYDLQPHADGQCTPVTLLPCPNEACRVACWLAFAAAYPQCSTGPQHRHAYARPAPLPPYRAQGR
jgi:hypothetical protein